MNREYIIKPHTTLIEALRLMDEREKKSFVICDEDKFIGLISIGDIQRAILSKASMNELVVDYIRPDIKYAKSTDNYNEIKVLMQKERIECMPVVDTDSNLVNIIEWKDLFDGRNLKPVNCPVVIMAGGKGERLKPLTNIIPKPLIPISKKTIIEEIMDRFVEVNCRDFYLSVNYMSDAIKDYFKKINNHEYNISYFEETQPLGTAGSLFMLKNILKETFIVSNCDILVDVNFSDLINYHKTNHNIATLVSVFKTNDIQYGTVETGNDGILLQLNEKPKTNYQINAGLYVLEPEIFSYIKDNEFLHITTLLTRLVNDNKNVGVFPVSEKSWSDMGNWTEYLRIINRSL